MLQDYQNIFRATVLVSDEFRGLEMSGRIFHRSLLERIMSLEPNSDLPFLSFFPIDQLKPYSSKVFGSELAQYLKSVDGNISCLKDFGNILRSFLLERSYVRNMNCLTHPVAAIYAAESSTVNLVEQLLKSQEGFLAKLEKLSKGSAISSDILHIFVVYQVGHVDRKAEFSEVQRYFGRNAYFLELDEQNVNLANFVKEMKSSLILNFLEDRIQAAITRQAISLDGNIAGKIFSVGRKFLSLGSVARYQSPNWNSATLEFILYRAMIFSIFLGESQVFERFYCNFDFTCVPNEVALNIKLISLFTEPRNNDALWTSIWELIADFNHLDTSQDVYLDTLSGLLAVLPSLQCYPKDNLLDFESMLTWPFDQFVLGVLKVIHAENLYKLRYFRRAKIFLWDFLHASESYVQLVI